MQIYINGICKFCIMFCHCSYCSEGNCSLVYCVILLSQLCIMSLKLRTWANKRQLHKLSLQKASCNWLDSHMLSLDMNDEKEMKKNSRRHLAVGFWVKLLLRNSSLTTKVTTTTNKKAAEKQIRHAKHRWVWHNNNNQLRVWNTLHCPF